MIDRRSLFAAACFVVLACATPSFAVVLPQILKRACDHLEDENYHAALDAGNEFESYSKPNLLFEVHYRRERMSDICTKGFWDTTR